MVSFFTKGWVAYSVRSRFFSGVFLGFMLLMVASIGMAHPSTAYAAECAPGIVAPALPGSGYGAPYSFTTPAREALLSVVSCDDSQITIKAGSGRANVYIYPTGYVYREGKWVPVTLLPGQGRAGAWLTGSAYALVPQGNNLSMVAYICEGTSQGFQCGCRGPECAGNGRWTLQELTSASSAQSSTRKPTSQNTKTREGAWLMAYYPSWDRTRLVPEDIDWKLMTHIAFGPVTPNADGTINTQFDMKEREARELARQMSSLATRNKVTPVLFVGSGGEGRNGWIGATSPKNVDRFARALVSTVDDLGYQGLDIDWEPLLPEDHVAFERLARKLRELRPTMPFTAAVLPINTNASNSHLEFFGDIHTLFDQINVMTYDMAGVWSGWESWHHSALLDDTPTHPSSIERSMDAYVAAGVPKRKLGIGAPFYGHCQQGVDGPRQSYNGKGVSKGATSYRLIMRDYFDKRYARYDDVAHASYLSFPQPTGADDCTFITYMDERDARERAAWAKKEGYGGIIAWSLGQQHMDERKRGDRHPLLKALANGFLK